MGILDKVGPRTDAKVSSFVWHGTFSASAFTRCSYTFMHPLSSIFHCLPSSLPSPPTPLPSPFLLCIIYQNAGIIPFSLHHILDHVAAHPEKRWRVQLSFVQLYTENIQDLLNPDPTIESMPLRESPELGVFVEVTTVFQGRKKLNKRGGV